MHFSRKIAAFLLTGLFFTFTACEDVTEDGAGTDAQANLLTGGGVKTWKVSAVRQNSTTLPQSDCIMDDRYTFETTKSFELNEGANKCKASSAQKQMGLWELNNSTITIRHGSANSYLQIKSLTAAKLVAISNNTAGKDVEVTFLAQ